MFRFPYMLIACVAGIQLQCSLAAAAETPNHGNTADQPITALAGKVNVESIAFGRQGAIFVSGLWDEPVDGLNNSGKHGGTVCVWDMQQNKQVARLDPGDFLVPSLACSSRYIAAGATDFPHGIYPQLVAVLWDIKTFKEVMRIHAGPGGSARVAFSPGGMRLAITGGVPRASILIWDLAKNREE